MMMLYHEHHEDPELRPKPISPEQREDVIAPMAAGLLGAHQYFRAQREAYAGTAFRREPKRRASKVGRNNLCPCGSGKKYKKCRGRVTVNWSCVIKESATICTHNFPILDIYFECSQSATTVSFLESGLLRALHCPPYRNPRPRRGR
jgi:SEC-C motif